MIFFFKISNIFFYLFFFSSFLLEEMVNLLENISTCGNLQGF